MFAGEYNGPGRISGPRTHHAYHTMIHRQEDIVKSYGRWGISNGAKPECEPVLFKPARGGVPKARNKQESLRRGGAKNFLAQRAVARISSAGPYFAKPALFGWSVGHHGSASCIEIKWCRHVRNVCGRKCVLCIYKSCSKLWCRGHQLIIKDFVLLGSGPLISGLG